MARKGAIAVAARVDEEGNKFDKHGVRIGRWEAEPCGDDCMPNVLMACILPCVSAAQISHRMGGSYVCMLLLWGVGRASSSEKIGYRYLHDSHRVAYTYKTDQASYIVWTMVSCVAGLIWLLTNTMLRIGVRERFDLSGNCCCDCCCVLWYLWCSLMQLATHVKSYTPGSCSLLPDVEALDALPAYDDGETPTRTFTEKA